jgi:hypothetical protein
VLEALLLLLRTCKALGVSGSTQAKAGKTRIILRLVFGGAENLVDTQQRRAWRSTLGGRSIELHMMQMK